MKCPACKSIVSDKTAKYCPKCGKQIRPDDLVEKVRGNTQLVIGTVLLIIALVHITLARSLSFVVPIFLLILFYFVTIALLISGILKVFGKE